MNAETTPGHHSRADPRWIGAQVIAIEPSAAATATVSAPEEQLVQVSTTIPGFDWGSWLAS